MVVMEEGWKERRKERRDGVEKEGEGLDSAVKHMFSMCPLDLMKLY